MGVARQITLMSEPVRPLSSNGAATAYFQPVVAMRISAHCNNFLRRPPASTILVKQNIFKNVIVLLAFGAERSFFLWNSPTYRRFLVPHPLPSNVVFLPCHQTHAPLSLPVAPRETILLSAAEVLPVSL